MFDFIQTFMTVGLADVSSRIGLSSEQEAEKYIRDMVRSLYLIDDMLMFSFSFFPHPLSLSLPLSPFLPPSLSADRGW